MDNLVAVTVGGLLALAGGLVFRAVEARQQRRHWFRDHMREAAERFLTDGQRFMDVCWEKLVGELPDGSQAIRGPTAALEVDISRLQLVAPKAVSEAAAGVFQKLKAAFDAAQMASSPFDGEKWSSAQAKAEAASKSMADFGDLVRSKLD